jgi:multiple sugar transport system permease protein
MTSQANAVAPERNTFWEIMTNEKYFKWMLLLPLYLMLAIFAIYPTFYCLYYSFHEWGMIKDPVFIGLENFREVLQDSEFWEAIGRTFQVLVMSIVIELCLGMGIALLFNRDFKGQNAIRGIILLPLLISPMAVSMMWKFFYQYDFGIFNVVLTSLGFSKIQFLSLDFALYSVAAISIWQWTPFSIFVLLAGLKSLPKDSFEATRVDGATPWYTFRRVTLPMLMPLIMIIILLRTMWLIRLFDPLYATTRGGVGTELLDWQVYRTAFVYFDIGVGSAMAIISLFLTLVVCVILFRQLMKALGAASA